MKKIKRIGAYGVLLKKKKIALVKKVKDPYEGLLDLPGGAIEFGESPPEALKREIREELALEASGIKIYDSYSYSGSYLKDPSFEFHHLAIVYKIDFFRPIIECVAEDIWGWYLIDKLSVNELTPFAQKVLLSIFAK